MRTQILASSCKLSSCFQQGFSHPTVQREVVGLLVVAVVVMIIKGLRR